MTYAWRRQDDGRWTEHDLSAGPLPLWTPLVIEDADGYAWAAARQVGASGALLGAIAQAEEALGSDDDLHVRDGNIIEVLKFWRRC